MSGPWRPREVEAYARWVLATAALVVESSQPASRRWVVDVAYRLNALHPHDRCFLTAQESGLASALRRWAALDQRDADTSTVREAMRRALSVPL